MSNFRYMLKEGRKNPRAMAKDSANYFLENPEKAKEDWVIFEYPSNLKANEVRELIKRNSPKIKIVLKGKKITKSAKLSAMVQILQIEDKYPPISYLVRYIDQEGFKYNWKSGENKFRKSTGIALESIQTYTIKHLLSKGDIIVLVFTKKTIPEKRGSGAFLVEDRLIKKFIISSK